MLSVQSFINVREKIRTPDLLVRSQTLYPAELRAHAVVTRSQRNLVYNRFEVLSIDSGKKVLKNFTRILSVQNPWCL